jgi:hypothetical protein
VKKIFALLLAVLAVFAIASCVSEPAPQEDSPMDVTVAYPPKILEHKGTAWGTNPPAWLMEALKGYKFVERMADYQGKIVVIVEQDGESREGAELAASRLDAIPRISTLMGLRVKDTFAGAQVGDKDKIETYMERVVKVASETRFSGFMMEDSWWTYLQTYTPEGKPDKRSYRVIQLWTMSKEALERQLDGILKGEAANEPKTPEKERAIQAVQNAFYEGF